MRESIVQYFWEFQKFPHINLKTTDGERLRIISPGILNSHSGPDFDNSIIEIEGYLWYGKVELHVKTSYWYAHNHNEDYAYDQVILHVVWEEDKKVYRTDGSPIPCLKLQDLVPPQLIKQAKLFRVTDRLPCAFYLSKLPQIYSVSMYEKVLVERLNRKIQHILTMTDEKLYGEEVLYRLLLQNFGFKYNKEGFTQLGKALPFSVIRKHANQPLQTLSLLLGVAGFLNPNNYKNNFEDFEVELHNEYLFLNHKYNLSHKQIEPSVFKRKGFRPSNHPRRRIFQLALLFSKRLDLFSIFTQNYSKKEYYKLLSIPTPLSIQIQFPEKYGNPTLTNRLIDNLLINTVIPFKYYMAKQNSLDKLDEIIQLLFEIKKEDNKKTRVFEENGFKHNTAADSQSLLELWEGYCSKSKCLQCQIGIKIMNNVYTQN